MLKVGLTGSIAVGKSFVCEILRELGCHVLDADKTARDVVAKDADGLAEIISQFGNDVLQPDGELDRKKMASIVFADYKKRELLNSIIHPRVFEAQDKWIRNTESTDPTGIAVIDAALMIESGGYKRFNKIVVVWCKPTIQLRRLMLRDNLSEKDAKLRVSAQMSQDEKKQFADFLINTSVGYGDTRHQTVKLVSKLKELSP